MSVTPAQVEARLLELSKQIDESHDDLSASESKYHVAKAAYEIAIARSRMANRANAGKISVSQVEDMALLDNAEQHMELAIAETQVKASRANVQRLRTQVDIARSISVSVRTSMEIV